MSCYKDDAYLEEALSFLASLHRALGTESDKHSHTLLKDEYNCTLTRLHKLREEHDRLRERLQFDPGGSDKIDELEQAMQFMRHYLECATDTVNLLMQLGNTLAATLDVILDRCPYGSCTADTSCDFCKAAEEKLSAWHQQIGKIHKRNP